jgi:acetyl esterase/lipase
MNPPATIRAAILLAVVLDVPVLGATVRALTRVPRTENTEIDGVPIDIFRPGGSGPWPAWVFVTGADPRRRREPIVQRLAQALARAGYITLVPDLPGLGEGELSERTLAAAVAVIETAAGLPDVRNGRVAVCGASAGASLGLLAAADPSLSHRVSVVAAVTPWADLERIIRLATTSLYEEDGELVEYPVTPLLRRVVARSVAAALSASEDREALLAQLRIDSDDIDACAELRRLDIERLGPEGRAAINLLVNEDPARFAELYAALPNQVRSFVSALSPYATAASLTSHVEIVRPPVDQYFPVGEALALVEALASARLTVTSVLDHTRPSLTLRRAPDLIRFNRFVIRGLGAAAT